MPSHRIDKFSFGSPQGGIVQPLEGDEKIANKSEYSEYCKLNTMSISIFNNRNIPLTFRAELTCWFITQLDMEDRTKLAGLPQCSHLKGRFCLYACTYFDDVPE